jgi:uncharacterized membrane protein
MTTAALFLTTAALFLTIAASLLTMMRGASRQGNRLSALGVKKMLIVIHNLRRRSSPFKDV